MSDDDDGGLPEESRGKLEQTSAVAINPRTPWKIDGRSVVQNYDDLIEFGQDLFSARSSTERPNAKIATVIVIDNESYTQHYPNNKQFWCGARFPNDPVLSWRPYTEFMLYLRDNGNENVVTIANNTFIKRYGGIKVDTYQGIPVIVPDPNIDHTRPVVQAEATTSSTTGVTVITKTTADPRAAGVVTESETVPAPVATDAPLTAEQREWLGNADPNDPYIRARMLAATGTGSSIGGSVSANLAIAIKATTGIDINAAISMPPCLPNNPPASAGVSGSGATPPAAVPYDDAILRQARAAATSAGSTYDDAPLRAARAAAAAPVSTDPWAGFGPEGEFGGARTSTSGAGAGRGNGAAELAQRARHAAASTSTAPTTVTQTPSTPTSTNQSAAETSRSASSQPTPRPPNVYVYEPLTPGFDRYDVNTGKKVYTPDNGPSRNTNSQPVVPQSTPRTPPGANRDPGQTGPF